MGTRRHPNVPRNGRSTSSSTRFHPGSPNQTGQIQRVPTTTKQTDARSKHQIPTPTTSHVQGCPARPTILYQTTKHHLLNIKKLCHPNFHLWHLFFCNSCS